MEGDEGRVILVFIPFKTEEDEKWACSERQSVKWLNRKVYGFDGCQAVPVRPSGKDRLVTRLC
jgi:hypothetical protein